MAEAAPNTVPSQSPTRVQLRKKKKERLKGCTSSNRRRRRDPEFRMRRAVLAALLLLAVAASSSATPLGLYDEETTDLSDLFTFRGARHFYEDPQPATEDQKNKLPQELKYHDADVALLAEMVKRLAHEKTVFDDKTKGNSKAPDTKTALEKDDTWKKHNAEVAKLLEVRNKEFDAWIKLREATKADEADVTLDKAILALEVELQKKLAKVPPVWSEVIAEMVKVHGKREEQNKKHDTDKTGGNARADFRTKTKDYLVEYTKVAKHTTQFDTDYFTKVEGANDKRKLMHDEWKNAIDTQIENFNKKDVRVKLVESMNKLITADKAAVEADKAAADKLKAEIEKTTAVDAREGRREQRVRKEASLRGG